MNLSKEEIQLLQDTVARAIAERGSRQIDPPLGEEATLVEIRNLNALKNFSARLDRVARGKLAQERKAAR